MKKLFLILILFNSTLFACIQKSTGSFCIKQSDIDIYETQIDQNEYELINRSYYSFDTKKGILGDKWNLGAEKSIVVKDNYLIFLDPYSVDKKIYFELENENIKNLSDIKIGTSITEPKRLFEFKKLSNEKYKITNQVYHKSYTFDKYGRLIQYLDHNDIFNINYKDNKLHSITKDGKNIATFTYNDKNLLSKTIFENNISTIEYSYIDDKLLYEVKVDGNITYKYNYSRSNDLSVVYDYKNSKRIKYKFDNKNRIKAILQYYSFEEHDKDFSIPKVTEYSYITKQNHTLTKVVKYDKMKLYKYTYIQKEPYNIIDTLTILNDKNKIEQRVKFENGTVKEIQNIDHKPIAKYDHFNRITYKDNYDHTISLVYDDELQKIIQSTVIEKYSYKKDDPPIVTDYRYDEKGNLINLSNSKGEELQLIYIDGTDTIQSIISKSGKKLNVEYNEAKKPIFIEVEGIGNLKVTYDEKNDIDEVIPSDKDNPKIAIEITKIFQELMEMVSLSKIKYASEYME